MSEYSVNVPLNAQLVISEMSLSRQSVALVLTILFARCRPTRPRCSAAGAGTAAAGAAVHRQFDD